MAGVVPGRSIKRTWLADPTIYAPARYKRACPYEAFVPDELARLQVGLEGHVAGVVSEAERAIHALNDSRYPALAPLSRLLLRTESIASSKVEGMQVGVRALATAEARVDSGHGAGPNALEILDNIDAMELAIEQASRAESFGLEQVVAIHESLMAHAPNKRIAGKLRATQNWIGGNDFNPCGADFVPPPPDEIERLLTDLCRAIDDDLLPPVVHAALVHAQFETIHPFDDGNGRTGRALIHVVLRRRGVAPAYVPPVSVAMAAARDRYITGLTAFRGDDVSAWIEYFAAAIARSAELATQYLAAVGALMEDWRSTLSSSASAPRADAAAWRVIDILPAHPILTAAAAIVATGRARSQVYQALEQLEHAGVLLPTSSSRRNRSWEGAGMLDLIETMEVS